MGRPKAVVDLAGVPMIRRTLAKFAAIEEILEAVVVAPPGFVPEIQRAVVGLDWPGCEVRVVAGGPTRQESVRRGIESLRSTPQIVCIHDAARPLVTPATITSVLTRARETGAATAASRARDSVREQGEDGSSRPVDRSKIWLIETPQAFSYGLIREAHERARARGVQATDDATIAELCGGASIAIVEGDGLNLKVTCPDDLELVRAVLDR